MNNTAGKEIEKFCKEMIIELQKNPFCEKVKSNFNGVTIIGDQNSTAEELVNQFFRKQKGLRRKRHQSASYKRSQRQNKEEKREAYAKARILVQRFKFVDKTDLNAVLSWIYQAVPYSYVPFKVFPRYQLAQELKSYGYKVNENINEHFVKGDKVNEARWMIGQCISKFEKGYSVPSVFQYFITDWKENFEAA